MADLSLIKQLREVTGAGMMDCKKALLEVGDDLEKAKDWLRKKGMAAAAKKASRVAAEGLVSIAKNANKAAIIELNSETDFVAKNEQFIKLAQNIAQTALETNAHKIEELKAAKLAGSENNVEQEVTNAIGVIGENISLRRVSSLEVNQGTVATYIHNAVSENLGKIGVLVALESSGDTQKLDEIGRQIAMHIAASKPESVDVENLDKELIQREKTIFSEQAKASGKPDEIVEKMVEGRIRKYYEEVVLLEQPFVMDGKTKVKDIVANFAKENNIEISVKGFVLFVLGEGIEKKEEDFAAEVQSMAK